MGPGARLPRLPALYPKNEDRLHSAGLGSGITLPLQALQARPWRCLQIEPRKVRFYSSARQTREEHVRIWWWPRGIVSARVLFDGTNGISERKRDKTKGRRSAPPDSEISQRLALTRLPGRGAGSDVFVNIVGTFGVASASYYWSRVASALGRLSKCLTGKSATTWHQLVADDFHLIAGGPHCRSALIMFVVLCTTTDVPSPAPTSSPTAIITDSSHHDAHLSSRVRYDGIFWMRPCRWAKKLAKGTPAPST